MTIILPRILGAHLRTWLALSALWVAGVVVVAAIEALRSAQTVDRFSYSLQLDQLAPSGSTQVESFREWFFTERSFPDDGITLVLPLPEPIGLWNAFENITAVKQGAAVGKDERRPGEAYQTIVPPSAMPELVQRAKRMRMQNRINKLGVVLAIALLPPATLFFVVFVTWRIRMGFLTTP